LTLYKKFNTLIIEFKNEGFKPRHYKEILNSINMINVDYKTLTIGALWDSSLLK
jgi:hypothetical protein